MRNILASEIKKLLTVRSTWFTLALALLYVGFMGLYIEGYWGGSGSAAGLLESTAYQELIKNTAMGVWIFMVAIASLFIIHEYRYNTVMHTLTLSNSRAKVLAAKLVTIFGSSILFALICFGFALATYHLGIALRGGTLAPQVVDWLPLLAQSVYFIAGYALLALMIGFLTRNIVATILIIIIGFNLAESLLGLLLKSNVIYLPYTALQQVLGTVQFAENTLSPFTAALVFTAYLIAGWLAAWFLFLRRDAS